MKIIYLHIHGSTALSSYGAGISRAALNFIYSSLFSKETDLKLIPLRDAPSACQHFDSLYEEYTSENDRYYCQWSGIVSESAWNETAQYIKTFIEQQAAEEDTLQVIITGHSHGGTIARLTAAACQTLNQVIFHVISIATPLSVDPPSIMPSNVITWQHFYHRKDIITFLGSNIMQAGTPQFTRRIAGIFERRQPNSKVTLPESWQSHEITEFTLDPHNNLLNQSFSKSICERVKPVLSKSITHDATAKFDL